MTVGGVLTYEDVTNVDSVGIITAQSGIRVGAGESIGSNSGTVYYYGNGENLTGVASTDNIITSMPPPLLISIQPALLVQPLLRVTLYWTPTF